MRRRRGREKSFLQNPVLIGALTVLVVIVAVALAYRANTGLPFTPSRLKAPLLIGRLKMPFWFALFIGNVVGIVLWNWLVPWTSSRFAWWLNASGAKASNISVRGAAVMFGLYAAWLFLFSRI